CVGTGHRKGAGMPCGGSGSAALPAIAFATAVSRPHSAAAGETLVPFSCSICEQESTRICAFCTKDACGMHICERCGCCSDCCPCDVPLDEPTHEHIEAMPEHAAAIPPDLVVEASQVEPSAI